jgi:hypothetical protein
MPSLSEYFLGEPDPELSFEVALEADLDAVELWEETAAELGAKVPKGNPDVVFDVWHSAGGLRSL